VFDMTKFILTGFPRTGTTVVAGSIVKHPEILFYGEIFNNMQEVRVGEAHRITMGAGWKFPNALPHGMGACPADSGTHNYLNNFFDRDLPFKALGFKLMFDQVVEGPNSDVWDYIKVDPEIKIIRTVRENLLEVVCSFVRASITKRWHTTGEQLPNQHRFIVSPDDFKGLAERFQSMPVQMQGIEGTHDLLDLEYSKICSDFEGVMKTVFDFLGVDDKEKVTPELKKIAGLKPHEELANYEELKKHFSGTEYEKYFIY